MSAAGPAASHEAAPPGEPGWVRVCPADSLRDGGEAAGFDLPALPGAGGSTLAQRGFVVRFAGQPRAFLNRCAHVPVELDWVPGRFFDDEGLRLICAVHGAEYDPVDGHCIGGACRGRGNLIPLAVRESDGWIWAGPAVRGR